MGCPHCSGLHIVKNGHHTGGKLQLLCRNCHKHFTLDVAKGYPTTKLPYPLIAYFLYFRKKIPMFGKMREYRNFVSRWLKCLGFREKDVPRQMLHYWISSYEPHLETTIRFSEAQHFVRRILEKKLKEIPQEIIHQRTLSHIAVLNILQKNLGQQYCTSLIKKDREFFQELCFLSSKYQVYCWKHPNTQQLGFISSIQSK
jgi:hypothetical protein